MRHAIAFAILFLAGFGTTVARGDPRSDVFDRLKEAHRSRDEAAIFYWTQQAAAQFGGSIYRARVGDHYWEGRGVAADPEQAVAWYRSAAALGSPFGMLGLARAHFRGRGAQRSTEAAVHWLAEAANRGIGDAHFEVASHYLSGKLADDAARAAERIERGLEAATASARRRPPFEAGRRDPVGAAYLAAGDAFACPYAAPPNMSFAVHFWIRAAAEGYGSAWTRLRAVARLPRFPTVLCRW